MKKISGTILTVAGAAILAGAMMTTPADAGPRRRAVQNYEEQEEIGTALGGRLCQLHVRPPESSRCCGKQLGLFSSA